MKIMKSLGMDLVDYGIGFELDSRKIGLHSVAPQSIILPYSGTLPGKMATASDASIRVDVCPTKRDALLVLNVSTDDGRFQMEVGASDQEVTDLLDAFFSESVRDSGLDPLWFGFYNANYTEWRKIAEFPLTLLNTLDSLSLKEQTKMLDRWLDSLRDTIEVGVTYSEKYSELYNWIVSAPRSVIRFLAGERYLSE